jgi:TolB protein
VSLNNQWLAFASNRGGAWDLYLLELATGQTTQLSDDAAYDGAPSWSGDGSWLAYEHLDGENLEIYMRPMDGSVDPIPLTLHPGLDYAPAWRPGSQEIAFASTRGGEALIWLLDLEAESDQRFRPVAPNDNAQASPAWSPDGSQLAWAQLDADGIWRIYAGAYEETSVAPRLIGVGEEPQWSPDGSIILATVRGANVTYLTAYTVAGGLALPPQALPGRFEGMAWASAPLAEPLPAPLNAAAQATPQAAWVAALAQAENPGDPASLGDVDAPIEELSEVAIPSFAALRERTAQLLGWDALSVLGNAYVPISEPLAPTRQQDWLYTGRAFELHGGLLGAGWMAVVREEHEGQTYWRVFLRAADQAGGLGRPLTAAPWDFAARIGGNEADFQAGGALSAAPGGYWLDFTSLAADYGFERAPALANWRSYYPGSLHNLFVLRAGLSWEEAMLQLYSPEELATVQAATP